MSKRRNVRRRNARLAARIRANAAAARMTVGEWRALPRKVRKTRAHRNRKRGTRHADRQPRT